MNLGSHRTNGYVPTRRQSVNVFKLLSISIILFAQKTIIDEPALGSCLNDPQFRTSSGYLESSQHQDVELGEESAVAVSAALETGNLVESLVFHATTELSQGEMIFGMRRNINSQQLDSSRSLETGYCSISLTTRRRINTKSAPDRIKFLNKRETVVERVLVCSQIDELDYHEMDKSIGKRVNYTIQQIHIVSSEPSFVFTAVDLVCDRFNCSSLTVFNISGHELHDLNILPARIASWSQLEIVDLSNTSLKSIKAILPVDTKPTSLEYLTNLHLDLNRISQLDFNFIFDRMPNLRHLSLLNNTIYNVYCNESLRPRLAHQFDYINLAGNVINCNKTTQMWILKQIQNPTTRSVFIDNDKINCTMSNLNEMTWSQRISVLETKICDVCDCHSAKKTALQVDCRNKSLTTLPDVLPLNTRILNLTMNHITSLGVPENAKNWENVTYVHLEDNLISSFQQLELNSKFIRNLVALDVRRNKFQEFPSHILEQFVNLDQVHLSDNPWLCDCESTFAFQEWLQRQFHKVGDKEEIRCGMSGNDVNGLRSNSLQQRLSSRVIYKLSKSELCPQDTLERPIDWLDIVNILLGLVIVLILFKVLMDYIYQHRTKRLPHFFKLNI